MSDVVESRWFCMGAGAGGRVNAAEIVCGCERGGTVSDQRDRVKSGHVEPCPASWPPQTAQVRAHHGEVPRTLEFPQTTLSNQGHATSGASGAKLQGSVESAVSESVRPVSNAALIWL